jgi:hypothetical protein
MTAWVRSRAPSFAMMFLTWVLAVSPVARLKVEQLLPGAKVSPGAILGRQLKIRKD